MKRPILDSPQTFRKLHNEAAVMWQGQQQTPMSVSAIGPLSGLPYNALSLILRASRASSLLSDAPMLLPLGHQAS